MAAAVSTRRAGAGLGALLIAYGAFILLGMPDGMLGVAWPSMQETFTVPLEALGALLLPGTIAYMLMSAISGRFIARWGLGVFLVAGTIFRTMGILGYAAVPTWTLLLALNFVNGIGTGAIDTGFNTYVATNHSAGRLSWLHACFGLGATISPLIMTAILEMGQAWRTGYMLLAVLQAVLIVVVLSAFRFWRLNAPTNGDGEPEVPVASARATLSHPAILIAILTFFVYVGVEVTGGNWTYTLFTEGRGIPTATAGTWISVYWGSLTVGRILSGLVIDRLGPVRILRLSMIGAVFGSALVAVNVAGAPLISFLGLALTGFSLAAIFPTLIAITPARFGAEHAANAIGFQIGAAGLGFAALPGLAGILAARVGLEIIGPYMVVASLIQWALYEVGIRVAPAQRQRST
jgi:fucose permease